MVQALLRNRIVGTAATWWWVPVTLILAIGLGLGGQQGPMLAAGIVLFGSGLALGGLSAVGVSGRRARAALVQRQAALGHRFVCPSCLAAPGFHYACGACGAPVEDFVVDTDARWVNSCGSCGSLLRETPQAPLQVSARCPACRATGDRAQLHEQRTQVLGAATQAAFGALVTALGGKAQAGAAGSASWSEPTPEGEGERTVLVCLPNLPADRLGSPHAAHAMAAVWISEDDPLRLGQVLDTFVAQAGTGPEVLRKTRACVASASPAPELLRLVQSRFAAVETGISAAQFVTERQGVR